MGKNNEPIARPTITEIEVEVPVDGKMAVRRGADLQTVVASILWEMLQERGGSQTELARDLGTSQQNISRILRGGGTSR